MERKFKVGDKVVCVNGYITNADKRPEKHAIYTINIVEYHAPHKTTYVGLEELGCTRAGWCADRFVLIESKEEEEPYLDNNYSF